jgi:glycosyltransferase involved in cell wall biosynthesis
MAIKLSIITINYNNASGLKKTLDSVAIQTCVDFEHIIVDGASSDGSVDVIREYEKNLTTNLLPLASRLKWTSEKDTGIYNAMNKGIYMANGEYLLFLNSGDYLVDESVIENVIFHLDGIDIIQGNTIEEVNGRIYRNRGYGKSEIDLFDVMRGHFLHQASFCRKELFEIYGMYDESYRIAGDTKFFMNCLGCKDATFRYVDLDIANYDVSGISAQHSTLQKSEADQIYSELFSKCTLDFFYANSKKVSLYDKLRKQKLIWYTVMALVHIFDIFSKHPHTSPKKEQIK